MPRMVICWACFSKQTFTGVATPRGSWPAAAAQSRQAALTRRQAAGSLRQQKSDVRVLPAAAPSLPAAAGHLPGLGCQLPGPRGGLLKNPPILIRKVRSRRDPRVGTSPTHCPAPRGSAQRRPEPHLVPVPKNLFRRDWSWCPKKHRRPRASPPPRCPGPRVTRLPPGYPRYRMLSSYSSAGSVLGTMGK